MVASSWDLRGHTSEGEQGLGLVLKLKTSSASKVFQSLGAPGQPPKAQRFWGSWRQAPNDPLPIDLSFFKCLLGRGGVLGVEP